MGCVLPDAEDSLIIIMTAGLSIREQERNKGKYIIENSIKAVNILDEMKNFITNINQ
jgi:hypothetical protein